MYEEKATTPPLNSEKQLGDSSSLEKAGSDPHDYAVHADDDRYHFDAADLDRVQRRLHQRHVQMIAIAGTIGTGLFLGSGHALQNAGPLGALIAYCLVGSVAYSSLCAIGEMTSHAPISGTFPHFAARWVDPALGFAVGWNYFYNNAITFPTEITAATILLSYWDSNTGHQPIYIAVLCVCACLINLFGVRYFGESEFAFSIIKLSLITGLIIAGLVITCGGGPDHTRHGFQYWRNPGPIAEFLETGGLGKFLAILSVLVQAAFSFQGMELVAIAASETQSPRRNIAKAVRRVFYRILVFYILGVLVTGMLVPYNDPHLLSASGTAAESPYVIAMQLAGIKTLPGIINGAIFTSAFSAGNSYLFVSSRILYGLALRGQAPRIFTKCTKKGLPIMAVGFTCLFSALAFLSVQSTANQVFNWLVNLTTVGGFFSWATMNLTFLRFYAGYKAQGLDRKKLVYYSSLQPYLAWWGLFWTSLFILINGFAVFWDFNASGFLTAYINIPIFFGLYFGWKLYRKTKWWKAKEMDFFTGVPTLEETETPFVPPTTIWGKIFEFLF
ncbi:general amino acid permease 1 [Sistotremastrum suecicum HHB10207 ss-3]|uniref:General amino acid permease 1 n=1 Tax=Sistotremastrum suecicum HHB10207 ss-3 TaxID=1314776 RepID=A0A166HW34_9AGAM|nr:general amino acid permease 1 [Sistotremastrum suecicum HHB10207 ss-3]